MNLLSGEFLEKKHAFENSQLAPRSLEAKKIINASFDHIKQSIKALREDHIAMVPSLKYALSRVYEHVFESVIKVTGKTHLLVPQTMPRIFSKELMRLEKNGCILHWIKCKKEGSIDLEDLEKHLSYRSSLVTLCLADPLLGTIQDVRKIKTLLSSFGVLLHVDLTYAIGKFDIDLRHIQADFITCSLEVINSPYHAIVIAKDRFEEDVFYHDVQFFDFALTAAMQSDFSLEVAMLKNSFIKQLETIEACYIFEHSLLSLPNCVVASFFGCDQEALLYVLREENIGICQDLKTLLLKIGYSSVFARSSISFDLSQNITKENINTVIEKIKGAVTKLRRVSCHL